MITATKAIVIFADMVVFSSRRISLAARLIKVTFYSPACLEMDSTGLRPVFFTG